MSQSNLTTIGFMAIAFAIPLIASVYYYRRRLALAHRRDEVLRAIRDKRPWRTPRFGGTGPIGALAIFALLVGMFGYTAWGDMYSFDPTPFSEWIEIFWPVMLFAFSGPFVLLFVSERITIGDEAVQAQNLLFDLIGVGWLTHTYRYADITGVEQDMKEPPFFDVLITVQGSSRPIRLVTSSFGPQYGEAIYAWLSERAGKSR